eukprot:TRINITY_DN16439_c0_g1_i1.p1 TRINITY_DN16439_c0_g1~~TRINITY_DN16439_c0_g1_i1.p1  ORF type:complete len:486 (-),score=73.58 TRINITY_DN16439_c0_g1_i1:218-1639(-)
MGCCSAPASSAPKERIVTKVVPTNVEGARRIGVILPGAKYAGLINENTAFSYHLIDDPSYLMGNALAFDADSYVEAAIAYCQKHDMQGVFGFDCFPSMLASIVNDVLGLKGASFQSVFLCINKFYMRQFLEPEVKATAFDPLMSADPPEQFPVVVKQSDCQFYMGTWILHTLADWVALKADLESRLSRQALDSRKQFYFKWHQKLRTSTLGAEKWEDVVLFHVEPYLDGREHQIEVVIDKNELLVADTGDLIKTGELLVMFVTPGSFEFPKQWLHDLSAKMRDYGYNNQAMDVEFVFTKDGPRLIEINSRYSYMGWASYFDKRCEEEASALQKKPDLRNLANRSLSCLGDDATRFPADEDISKLAVMMYTQAKGPIASIVDLEYLDRVVKDGTVEAWAPKPPFLAGEVTEKDCNYPGGWAKIGCMLMTARRVDFEATNKKLADFQKSFFRSDSYILAEDDDIGYKVDKHVIDY